MSAIGYVILFTVIAVVAVMLTIVMKNSSLVPPEEYDEREWYDENGNHIYYDRKLIRQRKREARKSTTNVSDSTEEEQSDNSRWYDEDGNHVYYDRKIIRSR